MRIGEVLSLVSSDIQERTLAIQNPKSGRTEETVYVPRKLLVRLNDYVQANDAGFHERIFPISYVAAWSLVKKAGQLVSIELRPHDLRRHAVVSLLPALPALRLAVLNRLVNDHPSASAFSLYPNYCNGSRLRSFIHNITVNARRDAPMSIPAGAMVNPET
jgi:integrase/recombinase XerD